MRVITIAVTLKDIAEKADVSISTVSRVINEDKTSPVNLETARLVWKWIEKLGYQRNRSKQSNNKTKSNKIGYILNETGRRFDHPYFSVVVQEIESLVRKEGYDIAFAEIEYTLRKPAKLYSLLQQDLDGIIIISDSIDHEIFEKIIQRFENIVLVGNRFEYTDYDTTRVDTICVDRENATYTAVNYLIELGHKRIGFIGGGAGEITLEQEVRFRGFRKALQKAHLKLDNEIVKDGGWILEDGYQKMKEILKVDNIPTAVFIASDLMSIGAMKAIQEKGLKIPEDISIVSYDDIKMAKFTNPPLTTVHVPKRELGRMAVRTLFQRMNGELNLPLKITLPTKFMKRKSTMGNKGERIIKSKYNCQTLANFKYGLNITKIINFVSSSYIYLIINN